MNNAGLSGTLTGKYVDVVVDLEAANQIVISLKTVACDLEGELTIFVNAELSDTVTLRIIGKSPLFLCHKILPYTTNSEVM